MSYLVSTTGTQNPVVINDLGAYIIPHPTVDMDILQDGGWNQTDLFDSEDLQEALNAGHITMKRASGAPVINLQSSLLPSISGQDPIAQISFSASSPTVSSSSNPAVWETKILTTNTYYQGQYLLDWNFLWTGDSNNLEILVEVFFDGAVIWTGNFNTGDDLANVYTTSGMKRLYTELSSTASREFKILFRTTQGTKVAYLKEATFIGWRIG